MTAPGEPCEGCTDPVPDGDGCRHDGHVWCAACFLSRCPECADDARDDLAAELGRGD